MSNGSIPRKVLVVDDEEDLRTFVSEILHESGWLVEIACDGAEAIQKIRRSRPDLVVLDLAMPGMDGWGVLGFLRTTPDPPPVIVVSASGDEVAQLRREGSAEVVALVRKPFHFQDLIATCEKAFVGRNPWV